MGTHCSIIILSGPPNDINNSHKMDWSLAIVYLPLFQTSRVSTLITENYKLLYSCVINFNVTIIMNAHIIISTSSAVFLSCAKRDSRNRNHLDTIVTCGIIKIHAWKLNYMLQLFVWIQYYTI